MPRKCGQKFADALIREDEQLGKVLAENLQNDCEPLLCFAQQVNGYAKQGMCS